MIDHISCPNCDLPIDPHSRNCDHCGANLAIAAILAERTLTATSEQLAEVPLVPEILVPRLGERLIDKGVLDHQGLQQALDYQKTKSESGVPCLIGQALLDLGLVDKESMDEVITEQILQLQTALQQANTELEERVHERTLELENALKRLSELSQLKANFIANISHELRTPLTHIKGYTELLLDAGLGELTSGQEKALGVMKKSEDRLERLIEDLIEFSAESRGELTLELAPVRLDEILVSVSEQAEVRCKHKGIRFENFIPGPATHVNADRQKITWVITQLMDNAIKFTQEGGEIRLGIRLDGGRVIVFISDTGIGIAPDRIKEIFEPFHQLDGSPTRRYGGTGLGLSLVQRIVEAHGSEIKVQSQVEIGSSFEFALQAVPT